MKNGQGFGPAGEPHTELPRGGHDSADVSGAELQQPLAHPPAHHLPNLDGAHTRLAGRAGGGLDGCFALFV